MIWLDLFCHKKLLLIHFPFNHRHPRIYPGTRNLIRFFCVQVHVIQILSSDTEAFVLYIWRTIKKEMKEESLLWAPAQQQLSMDREYGQCCGAGAWCRHYQHASINDQVNSEKLEELNLNSFGSSNNVGSHLTENMAIDDVEWPNSVSATRSRENSMLCIFAYCIILCCH